MAIPEAKSAAVRPTIPMSRPKSLRNRIFLVLVLVSVIPVGVTLIAGTVVLRELVVATGSAGPWDQVARSGQELLDRIAQQDSPSPELLSAADTHREELAESVRLSRLYAFLGERVLVTLPFFVAGLFLLIFVLGFFAAVRVSRSLSGPVEELVTWTRALAAGHALPRKQPTQEEDEVEEFSLLRSSLRQTSEALREAHRRDLEHARMQSWSEMARRVAHDLKNPLTPMRMAADVAAGSGEADVAAAGEVLQEEIRRLDDLARTFSQFGRPPEGPMSDVDLDELLASLTTRLSTPAVPIRFTSPGRPVVVRGHLNALERVMRNLIANAQEASSQATSLSPVEIELRALDEGAEIRILDRGPGLPEEVRSRIWEPNFTTKPRGTGLGLPMVRQAILAHGGEVSAANREGGGAEFRIFLPGEPLEPSGPAESPGSPRPEGSVTR